MATHSSVLAWKIPGMGSHRVRHDWSDLAVAVAINVLIIGIYLKMDPEEKNYQYLHQYFSFLKSQKDQLKQINRQIKRQVGCLTWQWRKMESSSIYKQCMENTVGWKKPFKKMEWLGINVRSLCCKSSLREIRAIHWIYLD